jgi:hypothetical protein
MELQFSRILVGLHRRELRRVGARCVAWRAGLVAHGLAVLVLVVDLLRPPSCHHPRRQARDQARQLATAVEQFRLVHGVCPRDMGVLVAVGLLRRAFVDPWGQAFAVTCGDEQAGPRVCSRGPDRVVSHDDVCSDADDPQ